MERMIGKEEDSVKRMITKIRDLVGMMIDHNAIISSEIRKTETMSNLIPRKEDLTRPNLSRKTDTKIEEENEYFFIYLLYAISYHLMYIIISE